MPIEWWQNSAGKMDRKHDVDSDSQIFWKSYEA